MARVPQPVVYTEGEMALAEALKISTAQLRVVKRCPDCEAYIIPCDNGIWLDAAKAPDDVRAVMGIMDMAGMMLASGLPKDERGSRHTLHEHQPNEEA